MPWAKRVTKRMTSVGTRKFDADFIDFSGGLNTYIANDVLKTKFLRLAQNARITTLGEYSTRKGADFFSDAAGETQDQAQSSTTGAANQSFNTSSWLAQPFTPATSGRLSKVTVRLKNDASAQGAIIVEIWTSSSNLPGTMIARSSVSQNSLTSSYAYHTARFIEAPSVTSGSKYFIVAYVQANGLNSYKWSSTTNATTALTSADFGQNWSSSSFALNFTQHYAPEGLVKGMFIAQKSDGTKYYLFAHKTTLYSVNASTGALTTVKSGLDTNATYYRFVLVNDIVYYINGYDGLRKWNFTTESQVTAANYTHITIHKNLLFLVDSLDKNKLVYSEFNDYETFLSTNFIYVPAPKTGDPVTAILPLNGYLLIFTGENKFILSGLDNATFSLEEAPDQKGTYSQETVTTDDNFAYFLSDDGVYRTNGSEPSILSENIFEDIRSLQNKEDCNIQINKGRLYLWYKADGSAYNNRCYVWNLNFSSGGNDLVESIDTDAFVNRSTTNTTSIDTDLMIGSSLIGQIYYQELESNEYNNLGGDIDFILESAYYIGPSPAVTKQIRYWNPRFGAQSGDYVITCQYASDLRNNWQTYQDFNVQGEGYEWGSSDSIWGSFTWGTTAELQAELYVPGLWRRIAVRYKHKATRQPHKFLGHTLVWQSQRIR